MLCYYLFREYVNSILAVAGVILLFSLEFGPHYLVYDFWLPDSAAYLLIVSSLYAIKKNNVKALMISFALGVLCKEVIFIVLPVLFFQNFLPTNGKHFHKSMYLALLPGLVVFSAIRVMVPAVPRDDYELIYLVTTIGIPRIERLPLGLYRYSINTWELILFVLLLFAPLGDLLSVLREYGVFGPMIYIQLLVAKNVERLLVFAFPAVIIASLMGVGRLCNDD